MRIDVIHFNPLIDTPLFDKLKIRQSTPMPIQAMIRQFITIYWVFFVEGGIKRPIFGSEFTIDASKYTPIPCKRPVMDSTRAG